MEQFFHFLQVYETWLYLLLGAVALVYFRRLLRSWQEWRASLFGLERENAQRKLTASISILVLLTFLFAAEFILVSFVIPVFPKTAALLTPTLDLLATPTITLQANLAGVPAPLPEGTQLPSAGAGCLPEEVEWNAPAAGGEISGAVELYATINIPDLGYYKYEYRQSGSEDWTTLTGGNSPKNNELIGTWNTEALLPGDYQLRLVVYNTQNDQLTPCELQVQVTPP
ncbi:MAG: hypothetical protein IT308_13065 [Anaerolineaceae bacterium]|nr:hypothetical protein [Anaerolineaceae bacterium]